MDAHTTANLANTLLAACAGCIWGSFAHQWISRTPPMPDQAKQLAGRRIGLGYPKRSVCLHCHHPIAWWHNLPLVSYAWLRGHCRACQAPIGWDSPACELLCSLGFAFTWWAGNRWTPQPLGQHGRLTLLAALVTTGGVCALLPALLAKRHIPAGLWWLTAGGILAFGGLLALRAAGFWGFSFSAATFGTPNFGAATIG